MDFDNKRNGKNRNDANPGTFVIDTQGGTPGRAMQVQTKIRMEI